MSRPTRRNLLLVAMFAAAAANHGVGGAAAPAPSGENRALAETLFFTGRGYMEAGRFAEACQKFSESYNLDAAQGTLLNLAACHEKIGKTASAWGEFRAALTEARKASRADREQFAQEHIDQLEPELPYLKIEVPADVRVPGLEIALGANVLGPGSWSVELPVDPGAVEIVARAPKYLPHRQTVTIAAREHKSVTVEALRLAPPPPVRVVEVSAWTSQRFLGLGLMGGGLAVAGVGSYFGFRAIEGKSASDDACPLFDGERRCSQRGVEEMDVARRNSWLSTAGIGVGAAAFAVGTYLFVTGVPRQVESRPEPRSLAFSLSAGPAGAQGFLTGAF